ncbi:MAG: polyprenyl synthetase family protein [Desulfomicrobium sp.]|nr:polyprenyl synthetase family protein [Desulfomicrobium sp.]
MTSPAMKAELATLGAMVEARLETFFKDQAVPKTLARAMRYSLLAGGKRLRPVLCLAWADLAGGSMDKILDFACAIECIHTYSLIHDDLPAMDNDDLRRGKPSNHKQFDEATAILAGDGLLTEAFSLACGLDLPSTRILEAIRHLSIAAGPRGMVGGQVLDMGLSEPVETLEQLSVMHGCKTGALITSSCVTGAILGGGDTVFQDRATQYGQAIGLAFQVADDILDIVGDEQTLGKPVGSDVAHGKSTYPALLGIEQSRTLARTTIAQAIDVLTGLTHPRAEFLKALAIHIVHRSN